MTSPLTIPKYPQRPLAQDYDALRKLGIEYIQRLGSALWTDYNTHDPGVTVLELLCYALTELSYRASLPIEDLLAESSAYLEEPHTSLVPARRALTCNPVTLTDFRRLMLDVPGVANAWLRTLASVEPLFHVDSKSDQLTWEGPYGLTNVILDALTGAVPEDVTAELRGLVGRRYATLTAFEEAVASLLPAGDWNAYRAPLTLAGKRCETFPPQGLYEALIAFETDPELGDLGHHYYVAQANGPDGPFEIELHVRNDWQRFVAEVPSAARVANVQFSSLVYDGRARIYRTKLQLTSGSADLIELPATLVSRGAPTVANTSAAHNTLNGMAAGVFADLAPKLARCRAVAQEVAGALHQHRNLCEDLVEVRSVDTDEIGLCAEVDLTTTADVEEVHAQIVHRVSLLLAPRVVFYTVHERLAAGRSADEIFSGPACRHGFIDEDELERAELHQEIHTSDLIRTIMEIEGVQAVRDLQISHFFMGEALTTGERWSLKLSGERALRLSSHHSRLTFYRDLIPYRSDPTRFALKQRALERALRSMRLEAGEHDLDVPTGRNRTVQAYYSVQNDFPATYGIGSEGLSPSESATRHAQAKQLKAYLLFFDRMLADYLAQLGHIKHLLSPEATSQVSYFSQPLFDLPESYVVSEGALARLRNEGFGETLLSTLGSLPEFRHDDRAGFEALIHAHLPDVALALRNQIVKACRVSERSGAALPRIAPLLRRFVASIPNDLVAAERAATQETDAAAVRRARAERWDRTERLQSEWERFRRQEKADWFRTLAQGDRLRETQAHYTARRNRMLDHLMARFGEQFSDYVLLMYSLERPRDDADLVSEKQAFLEDFEHVSHDRGRAFNYRDKIAVWGTDNVSGFQKRVSRLLGIADYRRRGLVEEGVKAFETSPKPDADAHEKYWFHLKDGAGTIVLTSAMGYPTQETARREIRTVLAFGAARKTYRVRPTVDGQYDYVIVGPADRVIALCKDPFASEELAWAAVDKTRDEVERVARTCEGFHLVEHLLLRPRAVDERLMSICAGDEWEACPGLLDPYSFRLTVVVPAWPERFANMDFRRFFERTLRSEAPAHVHVKICWVNEAGMADFETHYQAWVSAVAAGGDDAARSKEEREALVEALGRLRSVYPTSRLYDCQSGSERPVLLDHSVLGSTRGDSDD